MDAGSLGWRSPAAGRPSSGGPSWRGGRSPTPAKAYHLELSTSHYNVSREVPALMREAGFPQGGHPEGQLYRLFQAE